MNENINICPCCPRGCDLSAPRCPKGEEYLRSGRIPAREENKGHGEHRHEHGHEHGCHGERKGHAGHCRHDHEHGHKGNRFSHYNEMSTNDKILVQMSRLSHSGHALLGGKGGQKRILQILSSEGCMTQRELTERLDIQPGSVSEIIKKLESAGYILRTANEADRRTADISLTEAGKAFVELSDTQHREQIDRLFNCLSTEESEQLLSLLEKLNSDWEMRRRNCHHHRAD